MIGPRDQGSSNVVAHPRQPEPYKFGRLSDLERIGPLSTVQHYGLGPKTVAVTSGLPNASKTTFNAHLGMCIAAGADFMGLKTVAGPVVYFAAEAWESVRRRAHAARDRHFPDRCLPFNLVDAAPRLGSQAHSLLDTARVVSTINAISSEEGEKVLVVFWDTLASLLAGGEENGMGMQLIADAAKAVAAACSCCVVLVHHPSKGDGRGLRGHGSMHGAVDTIIEIETDESTRIRTATLTKARDGATGMQLHYSLEVVETGELDQWGDPVTTVVINPGAQAPAPKGVRASGANQRKAITALRDWRRTHPEAVHISTIDVVAILDAQGIGRTRRPEVLEFLSRCKALTPAVGGYSIDGAILQ